MSALLLILLILTLACGKKKEDPETRPQYNTPRREVPIRGRGFNISINCYEGLEDASLALAYKLKGNMARGMLYRCGDIECVGRGLYVGYFHGAKTCLAKRGFEREFTLCRNTQITYRSSSVGELAELTLRENEAVVKLFCDKQITRLLPLPN